MNRVQLEDCKRIGELTYIDWERLSNHTVLITGSTGLIGSNLVNALIYINEARSLGIRIILPVRNVAAARELFGEAAQIVSYHLGDKFELNCSVDYIIHLASPTGSTYFTERPADTILENVAGTRAVLELAKDNNIEKLIYLSTMEVYGFPEKGHRVKEDESGAFETMNARNSYPIAKIACEALCYSYWSQYNVPVVILRATQTFGPGVKYDDGRVFAQFMRCAVEKTDIILKSEGLTERQYLYTADAVSAILTGMLKGGSGESYSVANPKTYISIRDMAQVVADTIAKGTIKVQFDISEDIEKLGYAATLYMDLDVSRMMNLGWKPEIGLQEMYERMIRGIEEDKCSQ